MRLTPHSGFKAAFCALSLTVLSLGCTPKEDPINPGGGGGNTTVAVTEVTVSPATLTLEVGTTGSLTATVTPSNATNKTVTWSSSDQKVATVKNGTVTAVAEGTATITATADGKSATCSVTVKPDAETATKAALMKIYNAMDGPHWKINGKWDLSKPLNDWECVEWWNNNKQELHLTFGGIGLKGAFPDCFDELTPLTWLIIQDEPGLTGTLPSSFGKLKNLTLLELNGTSMTGLPDIFKDIPLNAVGLNSNKKMTGPLPESLGSSKTLSGLQLYGNAFTGTVPDSWAGLGSKLAIEKEPNLDEQVPNSFVTAKEAGYLIGMYAKLGSDREAPVVVGDYDIPAFWPQTKTLKDLVTGKAIPFKEIYSKNKVTVFLTWATWCSFSAEMMPMVKKMYEKYHKDGLEIIAAYNADSEEHNSGKMPEVIKQRGFDQWYNFDIWDLNTTEWSIWCCGGTPGAVLVDKNGNIMASCQKNVLDPTRSRYGYAASHNLIPLLEEQFGPLEGDTNYASTDYSQDGKVITIQKASTGKGINLVFMGDAYTDKDVNSGKYEQLMRAAADEFFNIEPYKSFKNRFNVYAVKVVSKNGRTGQGYTTALGTTMSGGSAGTGNKDKVLQYALKVPDIKDTKNLSVAVMVNSVSGGGIVEMIESLQSGIGYYSSMGNEASGFGATLRHEMGHAFGFLADEYSTWHESPSQEVINGYTRLYETYGWYANIDFTSDPKKIKWADFLSDSRYKDEVGVFEGAINVTNGVYRPSENSMMNQNVEYFNAPSRWAIYKRIMTLSGETPSFSKFLEYDAVNRGKQHNAPRRAANYVEWQPDSAPVVRP